eukprot:11228281-Lingulodinium_polyedra.AAC.2
MPMVLLRTSRVSISRASLLPSSMTFVWPNPIHTPGRWARGATARLQPSGSCGRRTCWPRCGGSSKPSRTRNTRGMPASPPSAGTGNAGCPARCLSREGRANLASGPCARPCWLPGGGAAAARTGSTGRPNRPARQSVGLWPEPLSPTCHRTRQGRGTPKRSRPAATSKRRPRSLARPPVPPSCSRPTTPRGLAPLLRGRCGCRRSAGRRRISCGPSSAYHP